MFNMQDMLADMLKKSIPPEVMEKLTAENLKAIGDQATAFVADIRGSLDRIEANQATILMQNETAYERQTRLLEAVAEIKENGGRSSQRRGGKPSERGGASSGDGGSGVGGAGSDNG